MPVFMLKKPFLFLLSAAAFVLMSSAEFSIASYVDTEYNASSAFFVPVNLEAEPKRPATPKKVVAPNYRLRDFEDRAFEAELKRAILANPVWAKLYRNKKLSVGLVDMADENHPRFATLNGKHMMYAASLPKIAVLAAAHDAIERGELKETTEIKKDMRLMIAKSNNAATTRMIDRVGFEHIERTLRDPKHKLYDPNFGGGALGGQALCRRRPSLPRPHEGHQSRRYYRSDLPLLLPAFQRSTGE